VKKELTQRLVLAEQGNFAKLLADALAYHHTEAQRAAEACLRERTEAELQQAASDRPEDGCLRSATQLLLGDSVLPATTENAQKVRE